MQETGNHKMNIARYRLPRGEADGKYRRCALGKKTWAKMIISKIKLNPEQAVLTCYDSSDRGVVGGPFSYQCPFSGYTCVGGGWNVQSS